MNQFRFGGARSIIQDIHYSFVQSESEASRFGDMKISFMDGVLMYSRLLYSFIEPSLISVLHDFHDIVIICPELSKCSFQNLEFNISEKQKVLLECEDGLKDVASHSQEEICDGNTEFELAVSDSGAAETVSSVQNSLPSSWVCDKCGITFKIQKQLTKHIYNFHSKSSVVSRFYCNQCDKSFKFKSKLEEHSVVHTQKSFVCLTCGTKFKYQRHLIAHEKKHKSGSGSGNEKNFSCNICKKSFNVKYVLDRHLATHNRSVRLDFFCQICKKPFTRKDNYIRHIKKCNN